MTALISASRRFRKDHPCPVCGGYQDLPRGQGTRCSGYLSTDGQYAHCSREEHAGGLQLEANGTTYAHRLVGDCRCGVRHDATPPPPAHAKTNGHTPAPQIVATYDYRDAEGQLVFQVVRREPKSFTQRRPNGKGAWIYNLEGVVPVLYRLPELLAADPASPVYVVEGEKDADRLRSLGLVATTNAQGARNWRSDFAEALRGRHVIVLHDLDPDGDFHQNAVVRSLLGVAASVKTVNLPGLAVKGADISDWLDLGHTREELERLVMLARPVSAPAPTKAPSVRTMTATDLVAKELPEPRWAVDGVIPEGLTILGGKPKQGKSWMMLSIGTAVASGGKALGALPVHQGDVLYLSLEDSLRRLQDRLKKLCDDGPVPERLTVAVEWPRLGEGGGAAIETWLKDHPDARLVVIDTLARIRARRRANGDAYAEDYATGEEIKHLADVYRVAIVVVHHLRKMGGEDPFDLFSGTLGLTGAADGELVFLRKRGSNEAMIHVTGRDLDEKEVAVKWDPITTTWTLVGPADEPHISQERQDVVDVLVAEGRAMTPTQVAGVLGKPVNNVKFLMWSMGRDGQLSREAEGHYGVLSPTNPTNSHNPTNRTNRLTIVNGHQDSRVSELVGLVGSRESEVPGAPF